MVKGNAIIGYGGGPTCVINETAVAAIREFSNNPDVGNIWIMCNGIDSIASGRFYDARKETADSLEKIASTVCAAPGTTRTNPAKKPELIHSAFELFRRNNIRYLVYIGGNDTAAATSAINNSAREQGYSLNCVHAVKTVDNDLKMNHHCPGYTSAGLYVACATLGTGLEMEAMRGIMINVTMGRHTGFLAAASALAKKHDDNAPHLIYFPEKPITGVEEIINDIKQVYKDLGRCVVTLSEGAVVNRNGQPIPLLDSLLDYLSPRGIELRINPEVKNKIFKVDSFGHPELSSYSMLGDFLVMALKLEPRLANARIRAQTLGYNQRSFFLSRDPQDAFEAGLVGQAAAKLALSGNDGSIALVSVGNQDYYTPGTQIVPLDSVAGKTRLMPDYFIGLNRKSVTQDFIEYLRPLISTEIKEPGRFSHPVLLR